MFYLATKKNDQSNCSIMTTRKKKRPQEGGGFLKKVSSLFNLDTVIVFKLLLFLYCFLILINYYEILYLTISTFDQFLFTRFYNKDEINML